MHLRLELEGHHAAFQHGGSRETRRKRRFYALCLGGPRFDVMKKHLDLRQSVEER